MNKKEKKKNDIHHNNQDITMKELVSRYKDTFFEALHIEVPKIERFIPTEIVRIKTYDLRRDVVCELEDETLLHVEFQSTKNKKIFFVFYHTIHFFMKNMKKNTNNRYIWTGD
jgi:hypothetical protein